MAEEERFVVSRQDIEELVKWMDALVPAIASAKAVATTYLQLGPDPSLMLIPDCLPIPPSVSRTLFHMLKTWNSGLEEDLRSIEFELSHALRCYLQAFGKLETMLWGEAACKAGEYPDWWRDLLLGRLGRG